MKKNNENQGENSSSFTFIYSITCTSSQDKTCLLKAFLFSFLFFCRVLLHFSINVRYYRIRIKLFFFSSSLFIKHRKRKKKEIALIFCLIDYFLFFGSEYEWIVFFIALSYVHLFLLKKNFRNFLVFLL
jgi:hypothetical protein